MLLLNKQVDYHMIGIEGEVHSPCFTFEARSDDMSGLLIILLRLNISLIKIK